MVKEDINEKINRISILLSYLIVRNTNSKILLRIIVKELDAIINTKANVAKIKSKS